MIELRAMLLLAVATLMGCGQPSVLEGLPAAELPAVVVQPSDRSRQELRTAVARMIGVGSVAVGSDAFVQTSLLVIEKARPRGIDGVQLSGRDYDRPEQFRLFKSDRGCVLIRLRTGAREALPNTQCVVER